MDGYYACMQAFSSGKQLNYASMQFAGRTARQGTVPGEGARVRLFDVDDEMDGLLLFSLLSTYGAATTVEETGETERQGANSPGPD